MKTFRQYLTESTNSEIEELEDLIEIKIGSTKKGPKGYYINVDCDEEDGEYVVTDTIGYRLNEFVTRWNGSHKSRIDWEMPNSHKEEVYIHFK